MEKSTPLAVQLLRGLTAIPVAELTADSIYDIAEEELLNPLQRRILIEYAKTVP